MILHDLGRLSSSKDVTFRLFPLEHLALLFALRFSV